MIALVLLGLLVWGLFVLAGVAVTGPFVWAGAARRENRARADAIDEYVRAAEARDPVAARFREKEADDEGVSDVDGYWTIGSDLSALPRD